MDDYEITATPAEAQHRVDPKTAEAEFQRFAEEMDLDLDTDGMDEDDRRGFLRQKRHFLAAIMRGDLIVNDHGEAVYTPSHPRSSYKNAITFQERTGASLLATDGKKKTQEASKTYAMMADMTGLPPKVFAGLVGSDIKACEAIFVFLMD